MRTQQTAVTSQTLPLGTLGDCGSRARADQWYEVTPR